MRRPLAVVGFSFGGALLAASVIGIHLVAAAAIICVLFFLVSVAARPLRHHTALLAALLSAAAAFCVFAAKETMEVQPLQAMDGETVETQVWLEKEMGATDAGRSYLAEVRAGALPAGTRLLLWVKAEEGAPGLYDLAQGALTLTATDHFRAESCYLRAWLSDGGAFTVEQTDERPWQAAVYGFRDRLTAVIDGVTDGDAGALIKGMCFGDRTALSEEATDAFRTVGLSHLLAISGFHMTVIVLLAHALLRALRIKKRLAALLTLPVMAGFVVLTGASRSTMRAGIMCGILLLGQCVKREADARNSLGAAVLLITASQPFAVYDAGLLLSAGSVLGLLYLEPLFPRLRGAKAEQPLWRRESRRVTAALWNGIRVTLTAVLPTLPVLALTFGSVPPLSPLANLLADGAASAITACGCLGALLGLIPGLHLLSTPLLAVGGLLARYLLWLTETMAAWPFAAFVLDRPYLLLWTCALPVLLIAGWRLLGRRGVSVSAAMGVIILASAALVHMFGMRGVTAATVIPVSSGTAVLLERDGRQALVLTSLKGAAAKDTARLLAQRGIDRLAFVLYTGEEGGLAAAKEALSERTAVDGWLSFAEEEGALHFSDKASAVFWNDCRAERCGGWTRLLLGETRLLLCPAGSDAALLPPDWRLTNALLFDGGPPLHATALTAQRGVLACAADDIPALTKAMPWGLYPISLTAEDTVTLLTRGIGDIQE